MFYIVLPFSSLYWFSRLSVGTILCRVFRKWAAQHKPICSSTSMPRVGRSSRVGGMGRRRRRRHTRGGPPPGLALRCLRAPLAPGLVGLAASLDISVCIHCHSPRCPHHCGPFLSRVPCRAHLDFRTPVGSATLFSPGRCLVPPSSSSLPVVLVLGGGLFASWGDSLVYPCLASQFLQASTPPRFLSHPIAGPPAAGPVGGCRWVLGPSTTGSSVVALLSGASPGKAKSPTSPPSGFWVPRLGWARG